MKRILVALGSSPHAEAVLDTAARLAQAVGAKLVLFRAISGAPDERAILAVPQRSVDEILRSQAHADLNRLARGIDPTLIERITTELATPWDGIVREGKSVDADLIVLGSHEYGQIDRMLGTTASKVVNNADRNVLVVRTPL
jgi:nucleotide-binding universal stress UspA family protein